MKKGIKLSVAENHCLENTPVGYGFDNQYPGSRGSLAHLWRRCHYNLGQVKLVCETQGKCYSLEFQRLIEKIMVSQPPLLHGSDCVKLGLIEIKGSTSLSVQSARNSEDLMLHQLQSSAQGDNDTADGTSHPPPSKTLLHNSQKLTSGVSDPPSSIDLVAPNCGDESISAAVAPK